MISHAKISRHRRMFKALTGLSATCGGKKHGKKLTDEQALRFPKGSKLWKDTGFQGYEPEGRKFESCPRNQSISITYNDF